MSARILLVEDEAPLRTSISANLELEGFEIVEAASGAEALRLLETQSFDLMLTDIRMPGMTGVELFGRVRQLHPTMPTLLMTAFALEELIEQAINGGAFLVLPKPFEIEDLVSALQSALKRPLVLVIDDAAPYAEATAAALNAVGVRAVAISDGQRAIDVIRAGGVGVCVVDMVMPGLDGPTVIECMAAFDPKISFIGVSGHNIEELFRRAAALVDDFMRKPFEPQALLKAIARARARRACLGAA